MVVVCVSSACGLSAPCLQVVEAAAAAVCVRAQAQIDRKRTMHDLLTESLDSLREQSRKHADHQGIDIDLTHSHHDGPCVRGRLIVSLVTMVTRVT